MNYVVGSGPAGVSCAKALVHAGADVTLLDLGVELDGNRAQRVAALERVNPDEWQSHDLAFLKEGTSADLGGIPLKYAYGSDFPYRDPGVDWRLELNGVESRPSFARGGLSNVWGAAVLPYRDEDIRDWPVGTDDLAAHYRAVLEFMPLAARHDLLEQLFPLYTACPHTLESGLQTNALLADLGSAATELAREGISFGASRLAVWGPSNHHPSGCRQCGLCMYGCPYRVIYSSAHTLDTLREHPNFTYRNGVAVDKVVENARGVTLLARDVNTRSPLRLTGSRVFLACGVLATTKILLESLEAFDEPVALQDCTYFLLPLLRFRRSHGAIRERTHTLSQAFLEIRDPEVCDQTVHLQVYAYNELYSAAVKKLLGPAFPLFEAPMRVLLERLLIIQGYLPSASSPSIRVTLSKDPASERGVLRLSPLPNARTSPAVSRVVRKIRGSYKQLKAIPMEMVLRQGKPGRSFHSGGTFPMRTSPAALQTDVQGRPYGLTRVHAVDSTVFPSIPATTITLSVMANAHRIGSSIGEY